MFAVIAHACSHYYSAFKLQQPAETEERGRRAGRWDRDEGMKVAKFLGEKSLMKESFEGRWGKKRLTLVPLVVRNRLLSKMFI